MASDFDRDNSVDRLLKGARRDLTTGPAEEAGPACLDAETLAAWADGGLDADQARLVLAHVADCARCQAMSAAFFSADDGAAVSSSKVAAFRSNRVMYWLPIAVGTIAATLVIWLGIRGRNLPEPTGAMGDALIKETTPPAATGGFGQSGTVARQEPASPAALPPGPAKPAESKTRQRLDAVAPVDLRAERAKQDAAAASNSRAIAQRQGQAGAPAAPAAGAAAVPPPPPVSVAQPVTRATPPPPPVVTATPTPTSTPVQTQTAVTSGAGLSRSSAGVANESVMLRSAVAGQVVAEFASSDPRASTISGLPGVAGGVAGGGAGAGAGGRGGGGGGGRGAQVADIAPPRPVGWRILSSGVLEKSTDRVTWETITIAPPVQGLLQGSAPSQTVCWIVGRAGLVLLTMDGRQFARVTAPTTDDLVSVKAADALRATVTTADGRTFTTSDGGKSWK